MTRFARAKGSKASNEKLPNEATPWHLMKSQVEKNECRASLEKLEKHQSAKELIKIEKNDINNSKINEKTDWAEFDDNSSDLFYNTQNNRPKTFKSNKILKKPVKNSQNANTIHVTSKSEKKIKRSEKTEDTEVGKEKFNKKTQNINNNLPSEENASNDQNNQHSNSIAMSKRQKRNRKRKLEMVNNDAKRFKSSNSHSKTREEKLKEKGNYKRKKPDNGVTKIMINGIETEIVRYDGFPVKKEDADRLAKLRQTLTMKGIPKSEVDIAIKLERRKAEKTLARSKKLVCFHCRKSGHNLSECPEVGSEEISTGICFKCGSTEHTHFECKVTKDSNYRYAKCFICREQGHIAMQCPDNPKGMYPHGGGCKICGAVTHLKKDCPDLVKSKEESAITIETMDNIAIESLQEDKKKKNENSAVRKKIVKF